MLRRALSKAPEERFASCSDFVGALSLAVKEAPAPAPKTAAKTALPPSSMPAALSATADLAYELPAPRRRRREEDEEPAVVPVRVPQKRTGVIRWSILLPGLLALIGVVVFFLRWQPAPDLPVQVLDTKTGETVPPPTDQAQSKRIHAKEKREEEHASPATAELVAKHEKSSTAPVRTAPADGTADIDLLSEPPGAKMIIDGNSQSTCTAPCTLSLPNGRHTLAAESAGFNTARRVFNVPQNDSVIVQMSKSSGVLLLSSSPNGAQIFVDGKEYGHTPSTLHLAPGTHRLLLLNGAMRHEETLEIENDGFVSRSFRWDGQ